MNIHYSNLQSDTSLNVSMSESFTCHDSKTFKPFVTLSFDNQDIKVIVFDMQKLSRIDSGALGMLLLCIEEAKRKNISIEFINAGGQVSKMLNLSNQLSTYMH